MGPEAARTYWLRRGVVVVVIVALGLAVTWLLTKPRASVDVTVTPAASTVTSEAMRGPSPTPTPSPGPTATSPSPDPSGQQSPAPEVAPVEPVPSESQAPSPDPAAPCAPQSVSVRIEGPNPVSAGNPVVFRVVVTTSQAACVLDLAAAPAGVVVTSGNDRIWASGDCPDWQPQGTLQLVKGQEDAFEVGWPVLRSRGCELDGTALGSGTYVATASVGQASARHVMVLQG